MYRRTLIRGAATSAFLSFLSACGGGGSESEDEYATEAPDASGLGEEAEGYLHTQGADTLPPSPALDKVWLNQVPASSQPYRVRVAVGSQVQARVPVQIMDIDGHPITRGTTDAEGLLSPTDSARRFMVARAETTQGTLYGFELNRGAMYAPVIEVNLIGTLLFKLQNRMNLGQEALELLITSFLDLEHDADLLAGHSWELDQEAMRLEAAALGLSADAYLDQAVTEILQSLESSPRSAASPLAKSLRERRHGLRLKASGNCPAPFSYDSRLNENIPTDLERLVRDNWTAAAQALLGAAFNKIGEAYGVKGVGDATNLIIGKLKPKEDPTLKALEAVESRLSAISRATDDLLNELRLQDHEHLLDQVIKGFNDTSAIYQGIAERRKVGYSNADQEAMYNRYMLEQCQKLIARHDKTIALFDLFLGSTLVGERNVVSRWHAVYRGRKYYTAIIERKYNDLIDWYQLWNTTVFNYMTDAYTTRAALGVQALDTEHMRLMKNRLHTQTLALERLRPKKLGSSRLFFDAGNRLAWVGGCQKVYRNNYLDLIPTSVSMKKGNFGGGRLNMQARMRMPNTLPCPEWDTRLAGPGIDNALFEDFSNWQLPSKKNIEDSFANFVKKDYLDLFGTTKKNFNWRAFADHCLIPSAVNFLDGPADAASSRPIKVPLSNNMGVEYHWFYRYWSLNGSHFDLQNLQSKGIHFAEQDIRADSPKGTTPEDYVVFPVHEVSQEKLEQYLPWLVYRKQRG